MISEQVRRLGAIADYLLLTLSEEFDFTDEGHEIQKAADTIKSLSAKLQAANEELEAEVEELKVANMERLPEDCGGGWIYCGDGNNLPEEKINPITKDFCEYQVTFKSEDVTDIRHYKFGKGHWWNGPGIMDEYVIAWRQNIDPYHISEFNRR